MAASSKQHSWLLSGVLSACFVGMTATVAWYYFRQRAAVEAAAGHELAAVARVETTQIANWRRERIADGRVLRALPARDLVRRLLERQAGPEDIGHISEILAAMRQEYGYSAATVVDSEGDVRLRSSGDPEPRLKADQFARLCREAQTANDATLSDISPDNRAGVRLMMLSVPVGSGAIVLEIEPTLFLYPYLNAWPGAAKTGEALLCRLEGDDLVFLSELRQWRGDAQLTRRSLKGVWIPSPDVLREGVLLRRNDYRGEPVLAHARSVPDSPWILVAKVDAAEVDAPLTRLSQEVAAIFALIAIATAAAVGWVWKSHQFRARHESEERFRAIADDTPAKLWMASHEGDEFFINHGLRAYLGASPRSLSDWETLLHPEDKAEALAVFSQSFASRQPYSGECRVRRADGEYRWVLSQASPRFAPDAQFLGYTGALFDITEQKQAERSLRRANAVLADNLEEQRQKEEEIRALSARLIDAQEEERTRVSRELHDDLSQQIAALSLGMGNLKRKLPEDQQETRGLSDRIQQKLVGLSEAVRRISHELHPSVLQHAGLAAALRGYCRELQSVSGLQVDLRTTGDFASAPPAITLCIYRIVQEALRNVTKHAQTDKAEIELTRANGEIRLVVSDRGVGFAAESSGRRAGLGLVSMRERTRLVKGSVELRSAPGHGTTLTVRIPDPSGKSVAGA